MNDPYAVLGVSHDADENAVRQRYLELVRAHPPERDPERFAEIREAYDQLRDPAVTLENRLFTLTSPWTLERLLAEERQPAGSSRLPVDLLLSLGADT